jgi:hypothetical protein
MVRGFRRVRAAWRAERPEEYVIACPLRRVERIVSKRVGFGADIRE